MKIRIRKLMCNCFSCENNKTIAINSCENNKVNLVIIIPKYNTLNQSPPYSPHCIEIKYKTPVYINRSLIK